MPQTQKTLFPWWRINHPLWHQDPENALTGQTGPIFTGEQSYGTKTKRGTVTIGI